MGKMVFDLDKGKINFFEYSISSFFSFLAFLVQASKMFNISLKGNIQHFWGTARPCAKLNNDI